MHFVEVKGILSSNNGHGMNVFRGCTHGCIYCDARSKCYHTPEPFEDVEVKQNAVELLEQTLARKRNKIMIGTGSMSDPYIPAEEKLLITRRCLEVIERYGFGVTVHTKSDLVLRDFDLLERINRKTKAVIQMTLTTADDDLCSIIEPNVCNTSRRVEVLMEAKRRGIPTVVWITPVLPFINDTEENLHRIMYYVVKAGVKGVVLWNIGVTLREGDREYFYYKLDQYFPGMKERYMRTYGNSYELVSPNSAKLMYKIRNVCGQYGIMCDPDKVFKYLGEFEEKSAKAEQGNLFDELDY